MKQTVLYLISFIIVALAATDMHNATAFEQQDTDKKDPVEMIFIKGGEFIMGANKGLPNQKPAHKVSIDSFYIDVHEVTNRQYKKFLDETNHPHPKFWQPDIDKPEEPVVGITWDDAHSYAEWAGKRLPTEAEWEYAAGGGMEGLEKNYRGGEFKKGHANIGSFGITPIKSFKPNGYGLYDMIGNVWEWCYDWYSPDYYKVSPSTNPQGPSEGKSRVLRGGAWYCRPATIEITTRYNSNPAAVSYNIGFRCAKSGGRSK